MFQHITILFSFVFAIAFTHILASASSLIIARDRVRFSSLHALWMLYAASLLLLNWIALSGLDAVKHWSMGEVLLQLSWMVPQYFTCSLVSMKFADNGPIDMVAFYERQRPAIFAAFFAEGVTVMFQNFADRNNTTGWRPGDWIGADLLTLPTLVLAPIAGWAKTRWLQWFAVCASAALLIWFYVAYGNPIIRSDQLSMALPLAK